MRLLKKVIETGYKLATKGVKKIFDKDHSLKASFGNERDLIRSDYKGFSATGTKFFREEFSQRHLLVYGSTGVGKSTIYQIPTICNIARHGKGNLIINNPSGELMQVAPFLAKQGYTVYGLSPDDIGKTIGYNPLHRVESLADCHKVASLLVNKGESNSDFWNNKSIEVIALLADILREHFPLKHRNLANLYMLLETMLGNEEVTNNLFATKATERQFRSYQAITANSENTRAGILSSALSHISFIGLNDNLARLTATDTFNFSNLRDKKIALFINCKTTELEYYAPILGLFFEQLFKEMLSKIPSPEERRLYLCIDELSTIPMPSLPQIMVNGRKYLSILGLLQSENQLFSKFGEHDARTILNNATQIYMSGQDIATCEKLSRLIGDYQYLDDEKILRTRAVMTPSEIRNTDRVIIVPSGGSKPLHCKVTPWYEHREFKEYMGIRLRRSNRVTASLPPVEHIDLRPYHSN